MIWFVQNIVFLQVILVATDFSLVNIIKLNFSNILFHCYIDLLYPCILKRMMQIPLENRETAKHQGLLKYSSFLYYLQNRQ